MSFDGTRWLVSLEARTDEDPSVVRSLRGAEIERRVRPVIVGDAQSHDWKKVVRQRPADALGD